MLTRKPAYLVHAIDELLSFRGFVAQFALLEITANLQPPLYVCPILFCFEWAQRTAPLTTHSMSSKDFFTWSGRSLNFVERVNSGAPVGVVDALEASEVDGMHVTFIRHNVSKVGKNSARYNVRLWLVLLSKQ